METQMYKGQLTQIALTDQERDKLLSQGWSLTRDPLVPDVNVPIVNPPYADPIAVDPATFNDRLVALERAVGITPTLTTPRAQAVHAGEIDQHNRNMTYSLTERNRLAVLASQAGTVADLPGIPPMTTATLAEPLPAKTTRALSGTVNTSGANFTWVSGDKFPLSLTSIEINGVSYGVSLIAADGLSGILTADAGIQTGVAYKG